jgi:hypothetical protein
VRRSNKIVSFALKRKKKMTELKQIRVLVIDEVSMLSEKVVQIIENIARIIKKSPHVRQDTGRYDRRFHQLPPIETRENPTPQGSALNRRSGTDFSPKKPY